MSQDLDTSRDAMPEPPDEAWRRAAIADANHSIELSGGAVPADTAAITERWAVGDLTWAEVCAEIERLYPSAADDSWADSACLTPEEEARYAELAERIEHEPYQSVSARRGDGRVLTGRAAEEFGRRLLDQPPRPDQLLELLRRGRE